MQGGLSSSARATRPLTAPLSRPPLLNLGARSATNATAGWMAGDEAGPEAVSGDPSWVRGITLEGGSASGEEYQNHHTVEVAKTQADARLPTSGIFLAHC